MDHTTPLEQRWGGLYVTGQPSPLRHSGNHVPNRTQTTTSATWPSLEGWFDTTGYLSTDSDIVALLAFDHQMRGMNLVAASAGRRGLANSRNSRPPVRASALRTPRPTCRLPSTMPPASWWTIFCSSTRRRSPVRSAGRQDSRIGSRRRAGPISSRPLVASARSEHASAAISVSYLIYTDAFDVLRLTRRTRSTSGCGACCQDRKQIRGIAASRTAIAGRSSRSSATRSRICRPTSNRLRSSVPSPESQPPESRCAPSIPWVGAGAAPRGRGPPPDAGWPERPPAGAASACHASPTDTQTPPSRSLTAAGRAR